MLAFTSERFFAVFARYNEAIWPLLFSAVVTIALLVSSRPPLLDK
jgi:hypothetical protein